MVPKQHFRSIDRCDVCGDCGRALAPDEPVWTGFTTATGTRWVHPVCDRCQPRYATRPLPCYWYTPAPCEWCGRAVAFLVPFSRVRRLVPYWWRPDADRAVNVAPRHRRVFCSTYCRQRDASSQRVAARARARQRACQTCSVAFTAARSDGRYCSQACRQRAYRQRGREMAAD